MLNGLIDSSEYRKPSHQVWDSNYKPAPSGYEVPWGEPMVRIQLLNKPLAKGFWGILVWNHQVIDVYGTPAKDMEDQVNQNVPPAKETSSRWSSFVFPCRFHIGVGCVVCVLLDRCITRFVILRAALFLSLLFTSYGWIFPRSLLTSEDVFHPLLF